MAFSLTFSRAFFHLCAVLMLVCWFIGGHYRHLPALLRGCPPAAACLTLIAAVAASGVYTVATFDEWRVQFTAYSKLLVVPLMLAFLRERPQLDRAWASLGVGLVLFLALFTIHQWVPLSGARGSEAQGFGVFNNYIVEGLNLAVLVMLCTAGAARAGRSKPWLGIGFTIVAAASAYAVLFVNPGRAAQLGLVAALIIGSVTGFARRTRWLVMAAVLALSATAATQSEMMKGRIAQAVQEWRDLDRSIDGSSVGLRVMAWKSSLNLWSEAPLLGHGAGSYRELIRGPEAARVGGCLNNPVCEQPHNQYVYLMVELGLAGLLVFAGILISVARSGLGLPSPARALAPAFALCFAIHCCFDSGLRMGTQVFIFLMMSGLLAAEHQLHGRSLGVPAESTTK